MSIEKDLQDQIASLRKRLDRLENGEHAHSTLGVVNNPQMMVAKISGDAGSSASWLRLASISASATGDTLLIECTGGQYGASRNFLLRARIGGSVSGVLDYLAGNTPDLQYSRLVAYNNAGVITLYLTIPGALAAYINATVWKFSGATGTTLYPGEVASTSAPSGSLVFDSYTATHEYIGCQARSAVAQSVPNATWTAIALELESFDRNPTATPMHDLATLNSRIYARVPGLYHVSAIGSFVASAVGVRGFRIMANAGSVVAYSYGEPSSADQTMVSIGGVILLAAGDYVELYQYQSSGGALNTYAWGGGQVVPSLSLVCVNRNA
jgi:hypothetical protein